MRPFIAALICFVMILTAGIAYAGESDFITQQDQIRTQCDIGVPCALQVAVQIPFVSIVQAEYLVPNIRDVANARSPLYLITLTQEKQKTIYRQLNKSFRVTPASLPVKEPTITRKNRLHFDPGNC